MLFNAEIEQLFNGFKVGNVAVELAYLFYDKHAAQYIVYSQVDAMNSYSGDDDIQGVVAVYDFDIYAKANTTPNLYQIAQAVKTLLKANDWTWQPNRDGPDLYDVDTGYYHKTICFAKPIQI